jgi:hypothetical protein
MRKILCLALPALFAAACGSDGGSKTDASSRDLGPDPYRVEAGRDLAPVDTTPSDAPDKLDIPVAIEVGIDGPSSPDLPPAIDVLPATDQADRIDGPSGIDSPQVIDTNPTVDVATPDLPQGIDGLANDTSTIDSNTITSPDGRVFAIVASCESALSSSSSKCPNLYDDGLARVYAIPDAPPLSWTGAGYCAEGSLVYVPYGGTSSIYCYYSSTNTMLTGSVDYNDTFVQCGQSDTVALTHIHGVKPPCSSITWVARK